MPRPLALPHLDSRFWGVDKALARSSVSPGEPLPFATVVAEFPVWMKDRFDAMRTCPNHLVAAPNTRMPSFVRVKIITTLRTHSIFVGGH